MIEYKIKINSAHELRLLSGTDLQFSLVVLLETVAEYIKNYEKESLSFQTASLLRQVVNEPVEVLSNPLKASTGSATGN